MPVYTDKRNGRLFIQFRLHGETYKERLPEGTKKADAEKIETRVRSSMLLGQHGIYEGTPYKYERFIQDYYLPHIERTAPPTFEKAIHICKASLPFFKGKQMRSIRPMDIDRFVASRKILKTMHDTERKPATIARELSIISGIFSLAVREGVIDFNPVSRIRKPTFDNTQTKVLAREDEEKFFDKIHGDWTRDICKMVLNTGLRFNDVLRITRFHVDRKRRLITLVQGKTQFKLEVTCNDVVMEILNRRWHYLSDLLFPSPKTGEGRGSVRHTMRRACERAKIPVISIRDLRRTFATRGLENGHDAATIADALGHRDMRMILRYARSVDAKRKLTDSMASDARILPAARIKKAK